MLWVVQISAHGHTATQQEHDRNEYTQFWQFWPAVRRRRGGRPQRKQIVDFTQAAGEPEVEPYCLVNDLGPEAIPAVVDFLHLLGYSGTVGPQA
jgi:hypothetical protein